MSQNGDPAASFFTELDRKGFEPLLAHTSGALGIDLTEPSRTEHWHVDIDNGKVAVSHDATKEDAHVVASHELFDSAVCGKANLWTAMLRGSVEVEGDLHLVTLFERLLPGPDDGGHIADDVPR